MTSRSNETRRILDRFLKDLGEPLPSVVRMRRASNRVLENLRSLDTVVDTVTETTTLPGTQPKRRWAPVAAVAAALFAAAVLVGTLSLPSSAEPIARRLSGKRIAPADSNIDEGKLIRTHDSGGEVLALRDGSRVEMSEGVELSINQATDGIQIDLTEGNIIVTAAKQHGHLYVKTRDCVVSVVGTVFSVKAEATGSRVAVIEGEVHVQHGDLSQTLLPGQQVATSPEMKAVPLESEIGWSQDSAVHVAMLQQTAPAVSTDSTAAAATGVSPPIPVPLGQGDPGDPIVKNKALFFESWNQQLQTQTFAGIISYYKNGTLPPVNFTFAITGIQGRTISFSTSRDETFSYGCADCSFVVSESGISKNVASTEPGVEFKLSPDGSTLTATCHAAPCTLSRWLASASWARIGTNGVWGNAVTYTIGQTNPATPQTFTMPTSQWMSQQGGSALFTVMKPAGQ